MRRIAILLGGLVVLVGLVALAARQGDVRSAPGERTRQAGGLDVIEVSGRIDPVVADFVSGIIAQAATDGGEAVIIQLDSPGSVLRPADLDRFIAAVEGSPVPVGVWVGPSGSVALGDSLRLVQAADVAGMAPSSVIGRAGGDFKGTFSPEQATRAGLVALSSPTLGDFVVELDGRKAEGRTLATARAIGPGEGRTAAPNVRFAKLGLLEQVLHTAGDPQVAYLFLMLGLVLVVFEFFTVGVGVAGAVGAGALVLASYGLAVLPTSPLGLGLLLFAMVGFSIDIGAGAPRVWTVIATVCLAAGSWRLFAGRVPLPWITVGLVGAGVVVAMVAGMTAMLRARFATPTIGRESMIGALGEAQTAVDPDGTVTLDGASWRARTNRATPIASGDRVRVVAIDGLLLEVEPEVGGAKDAHH
ncbi:MAG: NfeD family protein [Acidimicrobiales bacterium]